MFDNLVDKLSLTFKKLKGHGVLSESNIHEALRDVRLALLEADVNFRVVKDFILSVQQRAIGAEVHQSLTPAQQFIKIVNDELVKLMGGAKSQLNLGGKRPVVILFAGLQGSGKTTTCGKMARFFNNKGKKVLLASVDIYRPAAIEQLNKLGSEMKVDVFPADSAQKPLEIASSAKKTADLKGYDILLLDTAGRLHIDELLMNELVELVKLLEPAEVLLVADAMMGQDSVNVAKSFNESIGITGVILTKLDGDARGGAALSIKAVTGKPIKFIGTGEKLDAIEPFYPERMASRILGMGDMLSFIEKAQDAFDETKAKELEQKIRKNDFTLDDFLAQIQQIKKIGSIEQILGMIPGAGKFAKAGEADIDSREIVKVEAIIRSMTKKEKENYLVLNGSRRLRIAKGSGTTVQDVNRLIKNYTEARKMLQSFTKGGFKKSVRFPF